MVPARPATRLRAATCHALPPCCPTHTLPPQPYLGSIPPQHTPHHHLLYTTALSSFFTFLPPPHLPHLACICFPADYLTHHPLPATFLTQPWGFFRLAAPHCTYLPVYYRRRACVCHLLPLRATCPTHHACLLPVLLPHAMLYLPIPYYVPAIYIHYTTAILCLYTLPYTLPLYCSLYIHSSFHTISPVVKHTAPHLLHCVCAFARTLPVAPRRTGCAHATYTHGSHTIYHYPHTHIAALLHTLHTHVPCYAVLDLSSIAPHSCPHYSYIPGFWIPHPTLHTHPFPTSPYPRCTFIRCCCRCPCYYLPALVTTLLCITICLPFLLRDLWTYVHAVAFVRDRRYLATATGVVAVAWLHIVHLHAAFAAFTCWPHPGSSHTPPPH